MKYYCFAMLLLLSGLSGAESPVVLEANTVPESLHMTNVTVESITHTSVPALQVDFGTDAEWPNAMFVAPEGGWDWSDHVGLRVTLYNPTEMTVDVAMRVDNEGANGTDHCNTVDAAVQPGQSLELGMRFNTGGTNTFWGMRGVPIPGATGRGPVLDTAKITAFQIYLNRPEEVHTLLITDIALYGEGGSLEDLIALPFIDRYGQYMHADWPGKLTEEAQFATRRAAEEKAHSLSPTMPDRDSYGGWTGGPQLEATGWFRTEKVEGKWWLVTPEGYLFFSTGMNCVGTWASTFVEGRDDWFAWLPEENDPVFGKRYGYTSGVHSMAEPINGEGRTLGFYTLNLIRKYGETWQTDWQNSAYRRLQHWGFNTIGNWSQSDVLRESPLPYILSTTINNVPPIEGAIGYWAKMKDVYDPAFVPAVEQAVAGITKGHADKPMCMGYFLDNELAWEGVENGALLSGNDQACRKVLIEQLQDTYETLEAFNAAWETGFDAWESLTKPKRRTKAAKADLEKFLYDFALHYFKTIDEAMERHAPNQLYLGCRFATAPPAAVRACGAVADIVSNNLYQRKIRCERYYPNDDFDKPRMIGEFHFGALDRGMFHTGLVPTESQEERAASYKAYVESVADCPSFVGAHWFQYVDEATTGRPYDGENYNIGFVTVTDTPYPELVQAAQETHRGIYERRYNGAGKAE